MTAAAPEPVSFASGTHRLFGRLYGVARDRPTVLLLHGLGFHSFEYEALAGLLVSAGLGCFAFDFRGHGRSDGRRGRWRLAELVDDARSAVSFLAQRCDAPIGAFGNSLGALVGVHLAATDARLAALAACGCPTVVADFAATRTRLPLLRLLTALDRVMPLRLSIDWFEPPRLILTDASRIRAVRSDPLIADARRLSPATYADLLAWNAPPPARLVRVPVLVLAARRDRLQPVAQSELLAGALAPPARLVLLDTASHVPNLEMPQAKLPLVVAPLRPRAFRQLRVVPAVRQDLSVRQRRLGARRRRRADPPRRAAAPLRGRFRDGWARLRVARGDR